MKNGSELTAQSLKYPKFLSKTPTPPSGGNGSDLESTQIERKKWQRARTVSGPFATSRLLQGKSAEGGKRCGSLSEEMVGRELSSRPFSSQSPAARGLPHRRRATEQSKYIPVCTIIWYAFSFADPSAWKRFAPLRKQAFSLTPKQQTRSLRLRV